MDFSKLFIFDDFESDETSIVSPDAPATGADPAVPDPADDTAVVDADEAALDPDG